MNSLLVDRIKKDFPNAIWQEPAKTWGIQCDTGWGLLVYLFLYEYTALCEKAGAMLVISQIKNKFGMLRLYCHMEAGDVHGGTGRADLVPEQFDRLFSFRPYPANPTFRSLVTRYEEASAHICELCGDRGRIAHERGGFLQPLCATHYALSLRTSRGESPEKYRLIDDDTVRRILSRIDGISDGPPVTDLFNHFF